MKPDRYIALITTEPLDRPALRCWLHCVRETAPPGTPTTVPTVDNEGYPRVVSLIHQETDDRHRYLVALTRDLAEAETKRIVDAFAAENPELDFDIQTSQTSLDPTGNMVAVERDHYLELCAALAKRRHEAWVRERTDAGWRYGTTFSAKNKTHPLLRPWTELPDRYRKPDLDTPQTVLDLLRDQGYAIVSKDDLERVAAILRAAG